MKVKTYSGYLEFMFLKADVPYLPNGRQIELIDYGHFCDWGVVLAKQPPESAMPWVTWKFYRNDLASTSYGNYFETKGEAITDYLSRLDEMRQDDEILRQRMEEDAEQHKLRVVG